MGKAAEKRDQVLLRMLKTPPKQHEDMKAEPKPHSEMRVGKKQVSLSRSKKK